MDKKSLTEADIRSKYIDPAIINRGWTEDMIRREHYFTDGRVIFLGQNHDRQKGKKADYILYRGNNLPIAILEAKDNNKPVGGGMQQAMEYAQILNLPFAYSSNGDAFVAFAVGEGVAALIILDLRLEQLALHLKYGLEVIHYLSLAVLDVSAYRQQDRNTTLNLFIDKVAVLFTFCLCLGFSSLFFLFSFEGSELRLLFSRHFNGGGFVLVHSDNNC